MRMNKRNYQKNWTGKSKNWRKDMFLLFCCTAAARPAAVTCWNICLNIFPSRSSTTIRISIPSRNTGPGYRNRNVLSARSRRNILSLFWKETTSLMIFTHAPREWSICRKAENAALRVTGYAWRRLSGWQRKRAMTILPQPFLSVL